MRKGAQPVSDTMSSKGGGGRMAWTVPEEQCLIVALKELVVRWFKNENRFKMGYLQQLELALKNTFPGCRIRANPHLNSKIHVWKKYYASLSGMLRNSGLGWNETTCMIDMKSEDAWKEYCRLDSTGKGMRFKLWPFYADWVDIFGKDRATDENSEAFIDVVNGLCNLENTYNNPPTGGHNYDESPTAFLSDFDTEQTSGYRAESSSNANQSKGKASKK